MAGRPEAGDGSRRRPPEAPTTEADEEEASAAGATTGATDGEATVVLDENDDDDEEAVASIASTSTRSDATAASASAAAAVDGAGSDDDDDDDDRRAQHCRCCACCSGGAAIPGDDDGGEGEGEGSLGCRRCGSGSTDADGCCWEGKRRRKRQRRRSKQGLNWAAALVLAAASVAAAVGIVVMCTDPDNREPIPRYDDPSGAVSAYPFEPDDERQRDSAATRNGAHHDEAAVHPIRTRSHRTPPTPLQQQQASAPPVELEQRIVNGHPTFSPRSHPHVVSILDSSQTHYCGGTLIAPSWVLTAAHCLYRPSVSSRGFVEVGRWRMGGQYFARDVSTFRIAETWVHPLHDRRRLDYDLALVRLSGEVAEPERFVAYLLDSYGGSNGGDDGGDAAGAADAASSAGADATSAATRPPQPGEEMIVLGWGSTSYADGGTHLNPGEALRYATVNLVPNRLCAEAYGGSASITRSMMCASDVVEGQDACQGDSGGPLVLARGDHDVTQEEEEGKETPTRPPDTVAGIVSFGVGCAHPTFPGVYASVAASHGWIVGTVCGEDPGACTAAAVAAGSTAEEEDGAKEEKRRRSIRDFWREAYGAGEEEEDAAREETAAADGGAANDEGGAEGAEEEEDDGEDADGGGLLGQQQQEEADGGPAASDPSPAAAAEAEQQQQSQSAGGGAGTSPSSGGGDDDKAVSLVFVLPSPASTSAGAAAAGGFGGTSTPPTPAAPIEPEPAVEEEEQCGVEHCKDCGTPFEATKSRRKRRRNCRWVGRRKGVRCRLYGDEYCPVTCGRCTPDADDIL